MTATVCRSRSPLTTRPVAMPAAHDNDAEACEFSTTSCSDSLRLG